jgi:hypothetical protein
MEMSDIPVFSPDEGDIDDMCPIYESPEADDFTSESWDKYLSAQVLLPKGDPQQRGQVIHRKRDNNGQPIGLRQRNPWLDTGI